VRKASIKGLARDLSSRSAIVVLSIEGTEKALPIWIGEFEAMAIAMELAGMSPKRPMTHDLAVLLLRGLDGTLERVNITGIKDQTYYATLVVKRGEQLFEVDARPSDSIVLSLKTGSPVYVAEELVEHTVDLSDGGAEESESADKKSLRDRLRHINPEDFGEYRLD
jgi:bifunctional DNase/RNase